LYSTTPDRAVSDYLAYLQDPESLRDHEAIKKVEALYAEETDPLERLRLHSRLLDLSELPVEVFEQAFIQHAKPYVESLDDEVPLSSFKAMGVPHSVLTQAGLI